MKNNILAAFILFSFAACTRFEDSLETLAEPLAPSAPVFTVGKEQLTVSWNDVAFADAYNLYYSTTTIRPDTPNHTEITDTSFTITRLTNTTVYYVWIQSKNSAGISGFSPMSSADMRFFITGIEFCNKDDNKILNDYGSKLYANTVHYLGARITCTNNSSSDFSKVLYIKIFKPSGWLSTNPTYSPSGYTTSTLRDNGSNYFSISGNSTNVPIELYGWGRSNANYNSYGSAYSAGVGRYEIWCDGVQLYSADYTLY